MEMAYRAGIPLTHRLTNTLLVMASLGMSSEVVTQETIDLDTVEVTAPRLERELYATPPAA